MIKDIVIVATLFAFGFAHAQQVRFGEKAGVNLSTLTNINEFTTTRMRVGFHVGGFAEIMMAKKFALQPEILYSSQGIKLENYIGDATLKSNINLEYLNVPIMAKYFLTEQITVEAGPQIGFLLSGVGRFKFQEGDLSESGMDDIKDMFKSTDFGINFGLGYELNKNIFFGIRSYFGGRNCSRLRYKKMKGLKLDRRISMDRLLYLLMCMTALTIYAMQRLHLPLSSFINNYVNDFLCLPILLGGILFAIRRLKKDTSFQFPFAFIIFMASYYSFYFEYYLPKHNPRYTADWIDVSLYFSGALTFFFYKKKASAKCGSF